MSKYGVPDSGCQVCYVYLFCGREEERWNILIETSGVVGIWGRCERVDRETRIKLWELVILYMAHARAGREFVLEITVVGSRAYGWLR